MTGVMAGFAYLDNRLHCDGVPLDEIAESVGTPVYIYSRPRIEANYRRLADAFARLSPRICYSVKANGNLSILRLLLELGADFDIVSGGELYRALWAGAHPEQIVFAGVGKTDAELIYALENRIGWINAESVAELERIERLCSRTGYEPRVALRLNPGVIPPTHSHIATGQIGSKFGISPEEADEIMASAPEKYPHLRIEGVHIHIGSQLTKPDATVDGVAKALGFIRKHRDRGRAITTIDIGGGFPIPYGDEEVSDVAEFAGRIVPMLEGEGLDVILEPGRYIVGDAGVLVTRVLLSKPAGRERYVIVDAGMNDFIRPALYGARHRILPVIEPGDSSERFSVAGPICESADIFARGVPLGPVREGDLLAIMDAGAYGASMASNYNGRPRPAEVLVENGTYRVIRRRESMEDMIEPECLD